MAVTKHIEFTGLFETVQKGEPGITIEKMTVVELNKIKKAMLDNNKLPATKQTVIYGDKALKGIDALIELVNIIEKESKSVKPLGKDGAKTFAKTVETLSKFF